MPHYVLEAIPVNFKEFVSVKKIEAEMRKATSSIREEIISDFRKTVQSWNHKVNFRSRTDVSHGNLVLYVFTPDEVYGYVNDGTRAHPIVARRVRALRIRSGYRAKTTPGVIGSNPGGYSGETDFRQSVYHPGTEARRFNDVIADKFRPQVYSTLVDAMWRGVS